jgi:transcriptional regulator with XRE-family HTH domain
LGRSGTFLRISPKTQAIREDRLSNERLRAAIHQAGLEIDDLARIAEVDAKTVRRWIAGRTPRGRYRTRLAQALGKTERELWPEHDLQIAGRDERAEILSAYAHTNDVAAPDWRALLNQAAVQIDLLDFTLTDVLASAGTIDLLTVKAQAGCEIRLLISAPDSAQLVLAEAEQGTDITLTDIPDSAQEAEHSITLGRSLSTTPGIEARTFIAGRFNTILRFDDEMLVTLHLYGTSGQEAPLLHLQRHSDHGLFEQFAAHYDAIWQGAESVTQIG